MQETPVVDERPGLIYDAYSRATAYSGACETAMKENGLLSHLSTAYTARDMIEILHKTGNEKYRYWGYSYGTVLAGVLAAMYPEKLDRMVSDGKLEMVRCVADASLLSNS